MRSWRCSFHRRSARSAAIAAGALIGWAFLEAPPAKSGHVAVTFSRSLGAASLIAFFALLIGLPFIASATGAHWLALIDSFYRAGSLVFGGGHVVLPLLQQSVVPPGWIDNNGFLAGYGAAQAVPGPLFTFAAYLGATMHPGPNGWPAACCASPRSTCRRSSC